jgi:DNA-binding response OmpR family regulator
MRLLLVDDEPVNIALIQGVLATAGYTQVRAVGDSRQVASVSREFRPDLVLLDLVMPWLDGYAVLEQLRREQAPGSFLPVMVLTADETESAKQRALGAGATDFLVKPVERTECLLRIRNLLRTRRLHLDLAREKDVLEERVHQRTAALESALVELRSTQQQLVQRERLGALGAMVTGIGHDFNNSLALILGCAERLQHESGAVSKEASDCAQMIVAAARDAAETVTRLRTFHRPTEAGEERRPLRLADVVSQAIQFTRPRWQSETQRRGAPIECVTEFGATPLIVGNPAELREMLTNLIFNAVDGMPQGGTILLRTRTENDRVVLEVRDAGTGMTEEVKRRCIEPFFTTKGKRGSGLGLSMVYGIVERHAGTMAIESILGHGTTFTLSFPIDRNATLAAATDHASASRPLRVLVVDDQPVLTEILAETLSRDWHTVTTAMNGRDAFEKFEREDFDLVITDKAMPEMNGDQLAAAIKARAPEVPIIMLTGFGDAADTQEEISEFVDHILIKPATNAELKAAITAVLPAA